MSRNDANHKQSPLHKETANGVVKRDEEGSEDCMLLEEVSRRGSAYRGGVKIFCPMLGGQTPTCEVSNALATPLQQSLNSLLTRNRSRNPLKALFMNVWSGHIAIVF